MSTGYDNSSEQTIEVGGEFRSMRKVFLRVIAISLIPLAIMVIAVAFLENMYFRDVAGQLQAEVFSYSLDYSYTILWTILSIFIIGVIVALLCTNYIVSYLRRHIREEKDADFSSRAGKKQIEFMTLVEREVRDPVDNITVLSDRILEKETSDDVRERILGIKESVNSMMTSFCTIREYSMLEAGQTENESDEYEITGLVETSCKKIQAGIERKHLDFGVHFDENMPVCLKGDHAKIRQILDNLLENAVKYTYEGSITLDISYRKITPGKIDVTFTVTDTGTGIRREDAEKLFRSIGKVGENKNVGIKGTGLGLLICKRLVSLLDGRISVESEIGRGSKFTFTVPQDVLEKKTVGEMTNDI